MATDIVIPSDLWEEDEETVITGWLADVGAAVEEGALKIREEADAVVAKGAVIGTVE